MSYVEEKVFQDEFKSTMRDFEEHHKKLREEVAKIGEETKESRNVLDNIHNRVDEIETKMNRPKLNLPDEKDLKSEYSKVFNEWIITGNETKIREFDKKAIGFPLMNETIDPQGGYFVPPEWYNQYIESLVQYSPISDYATTVRMNRKELHIPVQQRAQNLKTGAPDAGLFRVTWGSELTAINQTDTGLIGQKTLTLCDMNALPFTTLDMGEDNMYGNTEGYMMDNLLKSVGYEEGRVFTLGDGVIEPTGFLTASADYSGVTAVGQANTIGTSGNLLWDVFYTLPDYYARNGTWFMNRQTIRLIREWVDGTGQYLLTTDYGNTLSNRAPATIVGRPYQEIINMPAPGGNGAFNADDIPIVFGDMKSAYFIGRPTGGMYTLRDPFSIKGIVQLFMRTRVAGNVILPEALVKVKVAQ